MPRRVCAAPIIYAASLLLGLWGFEMEMWQMLVSFPPSSVSRWRYAVFNRDSQAPLVTSPSLSRSPAVALRHRARFLTMALSALIHVALKFRAKATAPLSSTINGITELVLSKSQKGHFLRSLDMF